MPTLTFAYYCSGHGYGHATRVSALAGHLLRLPEVDRPTVHIVSSAPKHVFMDSIVLGARYRNANIDPVIVQPLAYRVDRQQSVAVLKSFLEMKDAILETERKWLGEIHADCVLSDAAFIGCLAATAVGIPSILITNFTFDSVYSYLSTAFVDAPADDPHTDHHHFNALVPDIPVSLTELEPLVEQIHGGYRCADLLLRLPGYIPIPAFAVAPCLPSPAWVDLRTNRFQSYVLVSLDEPPSSAVLYAPIEYPGSSRRKPVRRQIIPVPLLVRSPSPSVYSIRGRSKLLSSIGVPSHLHDPNSTKILVVSFGGQVFRRPSRSGSATPSRRTSRQLSPALEPLGSPPHFAKDVHFATPPSSAKDHVFPHLHIPTPLDSSNDHSATTSPRLATASHLWIPGAPPASKPPTNPISPRDVDVPAFQTIPPTPDQADSTYDQAYFDFEEECETEELPQLLPDASWIAIVCGVSKEQWNAQADGGDSDLPDGFFVAPRDVYMPDLTAAGDVLLGKLGYGTVAECVDSCTPFVYVSRPLFIEEHGLRRLLDQDGVGVELPRQSYEAGDWASAIEAAWQRGKAAKDSKRRDGETGSSLKKREEEGSELATMVVRWAEKWTH
ncbi:hypothetical protein B0H17DRAFT_1032391 [Mycena rosella]|uniref:L-arabinokinase n=1 Tax=Mycena rosella TaxID=1033263 RepID=A0AAD7GX79_MYCRO|nr:hypothetical protein B0H17DRAFT_1032391 [Mycena rosella]